MATLTVLVLGIMTLVGLWWYHRLSYWRRRGIVHDPPHILKGNMQEWMKTKQVGEIYKCIYEKYKGQGPFAGFYYSLRIAVVALDLDFIKSVLVQDFEKFHDRGLFHNERDDPLSANLLNKEGQKWRTLRQKLTPNFILGKINIMFPKVIKLGEELVQVIAEKTSAAPMVLEITELMGSYTADVIGSCAFGLDCNSLRNKNTEFVRMGRTAIRERRYGNAMNILLFGFPKLGARLRLKFTLQSVEDFYMGIVKETVNYRMEHNIKRNDFMDMLIDMKRKHDEGNIAEGLTFNEIVAVAFIFFVAGFETSSTTMAFALYELAMNQSVQDKLRAEITTVLSKHSNEFTYESMKEMHYLKQVINETMRKHPVGNHLSRIVTRHYQHSNPKYYLEPGTMVFVPVLALHHDPEFFPEPEKFKPERFTEAENKKRPAFCYLPFGLGPRICIGLRFGRMQTAIGLAKLVQHFKFEVDPVHTEVPMRMNIKQVLLGPEGGIYLKVTQL